MKTIGINVIDPKQSETNLDLRLIEVTKGMNYQVCSVASTVNWKEKYGEELPRELQASSSVSMSSILNFIFQNGLIFNRHEDELLQRVTKSKDGSFGTKIVSEKELAKIRKKEADRLKKLEEDSKKEVEEVKTDSSTKSPKKEESSEKTKEKDTPEPIYHTLNEDDLTNNPKLTEGFKVGDQVEIDKEGNFLLLENKLILKAE